ncbi:MAG: ABC transporter permease subunit [Cetobacterium sp.]|uniref:ABC transporter permease n=1 Tax=unclassified Cetobacterium TaxID=2630983 RepID=UPI00163CBFED|nr:ABC transporter permease subunit [Cetobacterium sp. 2A]MBC2856701.1 ABC transporter permease subunit [Cetobacterium sp. 2A]
MKKKALSLLLILIAIIFIAPFLGVLIEGIKIKTWQYILQSQRTYIAIFNTLLVAVLTLIINILIGTPVALNLVKYNFKGKKIIELLVILPLVIPLFVTTMGIQFAFIKLGLIETILGVAIVHGTATLPYYIRGLKAGYSIFNRDYEKMGRMMGANSIEIFYKITLPIIMPAFIASSSLVLIVSFAQYLTTLIIGGGEIITIPILMFPYISGGDIKIGAVYSIIYITINLILILLLEKSIKKIYDKKNFGEKNDKY